MEGYDIWYPIMVSLTVNKLDWLIGHGINSRGQKCTHVDNPSKLGCDIPLRFPKARITKETKIVYNTSKKLHISEESPKNDNDTATVDIMMLSVIICLYIFLIFFFSNLFPGVLTPANL